MTTFMHFEIPADNIDRAKKFYGELFGWKYKKVKASMEYWMIETEDSPEALKGGAIMKRMMPEQMPVNYALVKSVDKTTKKVDFLGGKTIVPKTSVPDMGYFAVYNDTEGNPFGVWEDDRSAS